MKKAVVIMVAMLLAVFMVAMPQAANATGSTGQVCTSLSSGKVDVSGSEKTITVTAPDGYLIDGYCVKAGSTQQGNGPVYVDVNPPAESVTISHPSGKDISHYSVSYTEDTDDGTTPPEEPGNECEDACEMPVKDTTAPEVTKCTGVLSDQVFNDIVVPAGFSCTLVDSWVNGDVIGDKVRNVTLADTPVVGDIKVTNATGDFTFGPKGGDCRYDPMVGGSIIVKDSHNVLICQAQVCDDIIVKRNDGKITVRDTLKAKRLVVVGNKRFVADGNETHNAEHVIRLINNTVDELVVKKNDPRRVAVR